MSTETTPRDLRTAAQGYQASFAELLAEMRTLQERIAQNEATADLVRGRTEAIWRDIERLRNETRPLMDEIRALR